MTDIQDQGPSDNKGRSTSAVHAPAGSREGRHQPGPQAAGAQRRACRTQDKTAPAGERGVPRTAPQPEGAADRGGFPIVAVGEKRLLLNGRLLRGQPHEETRILLAIEEVTAGWQQGNP